ncbi:hypothetical protein C5E06_01820 [Pseudoclavibacter sp. RFBI5]|nr:hypothetical protein C5E06_01820 [Pseudoclavibacter sp. RFBI5]
MFWNASTAFRPRALLSPDTHSDGARKMSMSMPAKVIRSSRALARLPFGAGSALIDAARAGSRQDRTGSTTKTRPTSAPQSTAANPTSQVRKALSRSSATGDSVSLSSGTMPPVSVSTSRSSEPISQAAVNSTGPTTIVRTMKRPSSGRSGVSGRLRSSTISQMPRSAGAPMPA